MKTPTKRIAFPLFAASMLAAATLCASCEGDEEPSRGAACQSRCPICGAPCVYPAAKESHTDAVFDGEHYHKEGDGEGDHVWDFNGRHIGAIHWSKK